MKKIIFIIIKSSKTKKVFLVGIDIEHFTHTRKIDVRYDPNSEKAANIFQTE